jgi:hypothetical protein
MAIIGGGKVKAKAKAKGSAAERGGSLPKQPYWFDPDGKPVQARTYTREVTVTETAKIHRVGNKKGVIFVSTSVSVDWGKAGRPRSKGYKVTPGRLKRLMGG